MKYMLLIYVDQHREAPSDDAVQQMMNDYWAYEKAVADAGVKLGSDALQGTETATTVQVREDGDDGPKAVGVGLQQREPRCVCAVAAQPVDRLAAGSGEQPGGRLARHAVHGPVLQRGCDGLGRYLFGQVEISELADEHSEQPAPFLAEDRLDGAGRPRVHGASNSMTGRTSILPPPCAPGQRAAHSSAASRSGTSSR